MYALGHIAVGYTVGKLLCKLTGRPFNIFLVMALSLLPDIDFLIPGVYHRTITHSIVVSTFVFLPFLIRDFYGSISYFGVLISHSLIGDFFTGRVMLLWPLSSHNFIYSNAVLVKSLEEANLEVILFGIFITILVFTKDYNLFVASGWKTLLLFVPFGHVMASIFLIRFSHHAQKFLIVPHLFLLGFLVVLFLVPVFHSINNLFDIGV